MAVRVLPFVLLLCLAACAEMPVSGSAGSPAGTAGTSPSGAAGAGEVSGSAEAVQELVSSSRTSRRDGDYVLAQADIERALRIEPRNPYLWLELGEIHRARGDSEQAAAMARKAMSLAGSDSNAQSAADKLLKRASRR
jgi:tetratricopeptide (TPR) repeat protein